MAGEISPARPLKYGYRRGLVLGLTIAEMFLLILFALLLALAAWSMESQNRESILRDAALIAKMSPEELEVVINRAAAAEITEERVHQLESELTALSALKEAVAQIDDEEQFTELVKSAALGATVRAALRERNADVEIDGVKVAQALSLVKAVQSNGMAVDLSALTASVNDLQRLRGQYANLRQRLESAGLGLEMPPCWATGDGRPEYIFSVALTPSGLVVRDTTPTHRAVERNALPIPQRFLAAEVSASEFVTLSSALLDWSKRQNPECRFFVRVFDLTSSEQKDLYKSRLKTVESAFYKYEVQDVGTW